MSVSELDVFPPEEDVEFSFPCIFPSAGSSHATKAERKHKIKDKYKHFFITISVCFCIQTLKRTYSFVVFVVFFVILSELIIFQMFNDMEINDIDFSSKPMNYRLCFNEKCLLAQKCLRFIATSQLEDCNPILEVVNPAMFNEKNCRFFADCENASIAYGMKKVFENILVSDAKKIRIELIHLFGQADFYRKRNSKKPILPKEQKLIADIFAKFGYSVSFDKIVKTTLWKD